MLKSVNELFPLSSKDVVSSVSKLSPMNPIIAPAIGIIKLKATIIPIIILTIRLFFLTFGWLNVFLFFWMGTYLFKSLKGFL